MRINPTNLTLDIAEIYKLINQLAAKEKDPYETGFVTCNFKHDLLKLLWFLEDTIKKCDTYSMEDKWYQERTMELLKRK